MQEYVVVIGGVDHTMQLSAEDAERLNAKAVEAKAASAQNKARSASNK